MGGGGVGGKNGGGHKAQNYFGDLAGLIGLGPLTGISAIVVDDALVWPDAPEWPAGKSHFKSTQIARDGSGIGSITCNTPHGFKAGSLFSTQGFSVLNFNQEPGTVTAVPSRYEFKFAASGSSFSAVSYDAGYIFPAVAMAVGDLRRIGAVVYECTLAHNTTVTTRPPNATYWRRYRLGRTDAGVTNPFKITVPEKGEVYIYWGTADQALDTTHEQVLAALGHPPYRNQAVAVLRQFLFGRERATAPNLKVIGSREPAQSIITGAAAHLDADGQANPIAFVAELITHPIWGLGFTGLDTTSWRATADWALANSALTYCSPLLTRQASIRSLIPEVLEAAGCWTRWNSDGQIVIGHWPLNEAAPAFTQENTVDFHDLLQGEEVEWQSDLWDSTSNRVTVTYTDAEHGFKDRPASASDILGRDILGRVNERNVRRPHITRAAQALALAQQELKSAAVPTLSGPASVRAEKATAIQPGELFLLTHDTVSTSMVMRCTERADAAPPAARVTLQYESERSVSDTPYHPTPDAVLRAALPRPVQPTAYQLVQLPAPLAGGQDFNLAALVARANGVTNRIDVWFQQADTGAFQDLGALTGFAVAARVNADFPVYVDADGDPIADNDAQHLSLLLDEHTPAGDLDHLPITHTADEINDNSHLLFLFRAGAPAQFEILTVKGITSGGDGIYNLVVRRARFGTLQGSDDSYTWTSDDRAFLIARAAIVPFGHTQFASFAATAEATTFRLVPSSAWSSADVGDVYNASTNPGGLTLELDFTFANPFAPTITWGAFTKGGSAVSFATDYATTDAFNLELRVGSSLVDLRSASVKARLGTTDRTIWSGNLGAGSKSQPIAPVPFKIETEGDWKLMATVQTAAGRQATATLQNGGNDALLKIRAAGSSACLAPTASPSHFIGTYATKSVTLSCATTGATIKYQIVGLGASPSGTWLTYSTPISIARNKTLYAYALKPPLTDSSAISGDFEYDSGL